MLLAGGGDRQGEGSGGVSAPPLPVHEPQEHAHVRRGLLQA